MEQKLARIPGIKEISSKIDPAQATMILKLKDGVEASDALMKLLRSKAGAIKKPLCIFLPTLTPGP